QGLPAPLLHPLLGPLGVDRTGRHGELELRAQGQPRHHRSPASLQLRDGPRPIDARLRGPRPEAPGRNHRRDGSERERAQPARLLVKEEVEDFLYREAELLDERRYEAWLDLFTEDAHYWMPMRRNVPRDEPEREFTREGADVNWFDEGKETLARRVKQILTGV